MRVSSSWVVDEHGVRSIMGRGVARELRALRRRDYWRLWKRIKRAA